jgi:RNA polymerase sigma factor (sigma-70 family)
MGKKPIIHDTDQLELAQLGLSFWGRLIQVLAPRQAGESAGAQMEDLLKSFPRDAWFKNLAGELLVKLRSLSEEDWKKGFLAFCDKWAEMVSSLYSSQGIRDPFNELTQEKKAGYLVKLVLKQDNLGKFIPDLKLSIEDSLLKISQNQVPDEELTEGIDGIFTRDIKKYLDFLNLMMYLSDGVTTVETIKEAASAIRTQMDSQTALIAAIEITERHHRWVKIPKEDGFVMTWNLLKPKLIGKIYRKGLKLPGSRRPGATNEQYLDEELMFLQESVFKNLRDRINQEPAKVLEDAMEGKLHNSLVFAVTNDLRDKIKGLVAQKRDLHNEVLLSVLRSQRAEYGLSLDLNNITSNDIDLGEIGFSEDNFEIIIRDLEQNEKTVLRLQFQNGLKQKEIAKKMDISEALVSRIKKRGLKKLKARLS